MTYMKAMDQLINDQGATADGSSVILREAWEEGNVMAMIGGNPRKGIAALNPTTGRHISVELGHDLTNIYDLAAKDWKFIAAKDFY